MMKTDLCLQTNGLIVVICINDVALLIDFSRFLLQVYIDDRTGS